MKKQQQLNVATSSEAKPTLTTTTPTTQNRITNNTASTSANGNAPQPATTMLRKSQHQSQTPPPGVGDPLTMQIMRRTGTQGSAAIKIATPSSRHDGKMEQLESVGTLGGGSASGSGAAGMNGGLSGDKNGTGRKDGGLSGATGVVGSGIAVKNTLATGGVAVGLQKDKK